MVKSDVDFYVVNVKSSMSNSLKCWRIAI